MRRWIAALIGLGVAGQLVTACGDDVRLTSHATAKATSTATAAR